jgi:hypothetical protein
MAWWRRARPTRIRAPRRSPRSGRSWGCPASAFRRTRPQPAPPRRPPEAAAAATIALVARPGFGGADPGRGLAVLAVLAAEGIAVPSVRPAVLARWAARAWRPCDRCAAGGPAGVRCGACGARLAGGPQ